MHMDVGSGDEMGYVNKSRSPTRVTLISESVATKSLPRLRLLWLPCMMPDCTATTRHVQTHIYLHNPCSAQGYFCCETYCATGDIIQISDTHHDHDVSYPSSLEEAGCNYRCPASALESSVFRQPPTGKHCLRPFSIRTQHLIRSKVIRQHD